ncbi:MAG: metallophosphoesterase family protein [Deltaproteobacteria bacterium]|nr:metallophosphoesterase family protein [Deltaproteobacteria bacterium]MBW2192912.1 metallophosphoesterase family protein [Deltaproteobacteria bacterium]
MLTKFKKWEKALVGVISDTHGTLWPEAVKSLRGSDLIVHAGDIGKPDVVDELKKIAPVVAVRGNMDNGKWARDFPDTACVEVGEVMLYVLHDVHALDLEPSAAGISAVISGHTHRPSSADIGDVLFLNPGSAAYPRHLYPASIALLHIQKKTLKPQLIKLVI